MAVKRIILLTEHSPDLQTLRCTEQLRAGLTQDFQFISQEIASASWTRVLGCYSSLRTSSRSAQLVHAWGYRALRLATIAAECPIIYTPLPDDPLKALTWARTAMHRRSLHVVSLSTGDDRFAIIGGIPESSCTLIRPGIRTANLATRDTALRHKLGLNDDHIVVLAIGESLGHADHILALHAVTMLNYMNPHFAMLIWGRGPEVAALHRMQRAWGVRHLVDARAALGRDTRYETILPAADMALATASGRLSVTPVLACMAAGLPIVAPATYAVSEILEDHHTALLYGDVQPRYAAQRLLSLWEDQPLRRRLADQARAEAYEVFPVSKFIAAMREIYSADGSSTRVRQTAPVAQPIGGAQPA